MKPVVVKLGGSTANHVEMQGWIEVLSTAQFPVVTVPGGGPFADQVRFLQKQLHFSDDAAHHMAILAMEQFAHVIVERNPRFKPAHSLDEFYSILANGNIPVWFPFAMTSAASEIPHSWEVTSDSLAAWLCKVFESDNLLLIKQAEEANIPSTLDILVDTGIVDPMLPRFLDSDTTLHIATPSDLERVRQNLPLCEIPGRCIGQSQGVALA